MVEKLLAAGADTNKAGKDGMTPLLRAAEKGKDVMVEKLLLTRSLESRHTKVVSTA